ncbi:methyltransferase domain-containing protein [Jannaschia sp.]|nr:methyltransferase domain-containing protein [Jannaschia sp.]
MMSQPNETPAEQLKARLQASMGAHIDAIAYVPGDIERLAGPSLDAAPAPAPEAQSAAKPRSLAEMINAHYDFVFYADDSSWSEMLSETQFRNLGYWGPGIDTLDLAGRRLQDELLALLPEKTGRILDVACGMGASTARLAEQFGPENVWAINISEMQIESTRKNAPGCTAMVMDAVDMTFEDGFFDAIECIEAAFHFDTRRAFLDEALRVLKPGGRMVASDVLMTSADRLDQHPIFPGSENHIATPEEYRALLEEVGFVDIAIRDARPEIWRGHFLHTVNGFHAGYFDRKYDLVQLNRMLWAFYEIDAITGPCLILSATKPG